ncbi:hypothetical protein GP486_005613 [Trichoglossum hirsutum]|uniref:Uncharacterized protein n=1 Tax=Trichoglossum hirsutum TaxID=265104 RepID=A0A9P8L8X1_9PEZI|nr:hypothetical protein GP486_005613 [Trichoglossum hirsutum]
MFKILYQPLTLLDCLHTFCGFCLKQWFEWQTAHSTSPRSFSCPSCRAPVRETKPNATVTTLLDMFMQANPNRMRSDSEKKDIAKNYKPGDAVLPRIPTIQPSEEEEEDRRVMEEVRELSLREVGVGEPTSGSSYAAREMNRNGHEREGNSGGRNREDRGHRRGHRRNGSNTNTLTTTAISGNSPGHSRSRSGTRQVGHQSSLRDLLNAHDLGSGELQEIMRQIMEGGYLDGIDLDNIDVAQEDEISERIAEAYRQRQRQREQTRSNPQNAQRDRPGTHVRSRSGAVRSGDEALRSSSRTHLEVTPDGGRRRRASANRSETSPHPRSSPGSRSSADLPRRTGRSSTDLSDRPQSEAPLTGTAAPGRQRRRSTDPDRHHRAEYTRRDASGESRDRRARHGSSEPHAEPRGDAAPDISIPAGGSPRNVRARAQQPIAPPTSQTLQVPDPKRGRAGPRHAVNGRSPTDPEVPLSVSASSAPQPALYQEPSIKCDRCGKAHIEYLLHYNCDKCNGGNYNVCLSCFRLNKGCLHWYGFGYAALSKYSRMAPAEGYPPNHSPPHRLTGHRYLRPRRDLLQHPHPDANVPPLTSEKPSKRLQKGVFCDICLSLANEDYWKCDLCNEGEWGFCDSCVNRGRCCTHPILPTRYRRTTRDEPAAESKIPAPVSSSTLSGDGSLLPVAFPTRCNICKLFIPPSLTHFHCPNCNNGDYDICNNCYSDLSASGRISHENGQNGWRRCLRGHRMTVIGFRVYDGEQRRVVVEDLVGGVALDEGSADGKTDRSGAENTTDLVYSWKEPDGRIESRTIARRVTSGAIDSTTSVTTQFPPSGGVGMRVFAEWSYFPVDPDAHDLTFPRGAEIREVDNVNEDWFWGCYAGSKGMFPAQHVKPL